MTRNEARLLRNEYERRRRAGKPQTRATLAGNAYDSRDKVKPYARARQRAFRELARKHPRAFKRLLDEQRSTGLAYGAAWQRALTRLSWRYQREFNDSYDSHLAFEGITRR